MFSVNPTEWAAADSFYDTNPSSCQILPRNWSCSKDRIFFFVVVTFGFLQEVFFLSHSAMFSWTHPSNKVAVHHVDPSCQIISTPAAVVVTLTAHRSIFWGCSDDRFVSFLNKESPVTQIFLFWMVCIFSPFPSALPSVCRSFSLLLPSSHTAFCAPSSLRLLSLYSFLCLGLVFGGRFMYLFISISVLLLFLSTVIFSLILQQIFLSAVAFSFFPYHSISLTSHQGTCLPQKSSNLW